MKVKFLPFSALVSLIFILTFSCKNDVTNPNQNTSLNITSIPELSVFHNDRYSYTISTEGGLGDISYDIVIAPIWLVFDSNLHTLSGVATGDNLGTHEVSISISDNIETIYQNFNLEVSLKRISGGPWIGHFPHNWFHDGQPLIGENSVIYSDAASDDAKQSIYERVEAAFSDIKIQCNITNNDVFTFMTSNQKIDIYANRFNTEYGGGFTYNTGAIVVSPDSPFYRPDAGWCVNMVEHEMMHVMEYLLEGGRRLILSEVWFREGIAEYYAGNDEITNKNEMDNWLTIRSSLPGGGNPIKIHLWEDFPDEVENNNGQGLWYPMFELAVRYLLSESGGDRSMVDVKNMFIDMYINEYSFPEAFELYMGIPLKHYEDNFWEIMDNFLY